MQGEAQPPGGAPPLPAVFEAWEGLVTGHNPALVAVRDVIGSSWRRCLETGVDPAGREAPMVCSDDRLGMLRDRAEDLRRAAAPVMGDARAFLAETGTMMVLGDPQGVVLDVQGDTRTRDHGEVIRLMPGADWTEAASGTNAIGTALALGAPVQIHAVEHFCAGIKQWTCSAAVIHDPVDRSPLGVLDISGLSGSHNAHCLALAVTAAGQIESRLARRELDIRARLIEAVLGDSRWPMDSIVVFDHRGRPVRIGDRARLLLKDRSDGAGNRAPVLTDQAGNRLPDWLRAERVEPVFDGVRRIGSICVVPQGRPHLDGTLRRREIGAGDPDPFAGVIGESPPLLKAKATARRLAGVDVPVLLTGPTGTGKEVFARAIHGASPAARGAFIAVNCGALARDLLASELFGYGEGAFTGARRGGMPGKFEAADGGTLFLDEIGEMPLELQAHLLRVLEQASVVRVGEVRERPVRVRLVAATHRDLAADVTAGRFRGDLYFRIAVTSIDLPPLGARGADIARLACHFAAAAAHRHGLIRRQPSDEALDVLTRHDWPGNVRELRNVIEQATILTLGDRIDLADLPPAIRALNDGADARGGAVSSAVDPADAVRRLDQTEAAAILTAVTQSGWNLARAARRLGIAKSTLYEKLHRHGIRRPRP